MNITQRQPQIKLSTYQPLTNSQINLINDYQVPLLFRTIWRRIDPLNGKKQDISCQSTTYQCSPLDLNFIIEVNIIYNDNFIGKKFNKVLLTSPVKLSKQLHQRQLYILEEIISKIYLEELNRSIQCIIRIDNKSLIIVIGKNQEIELPIKDIKISLKNQQYSINIILSRQCSHLISISQINTGKDIKIKLSKFDCIFNSREDRDIILLNIKQINLRNTSSRQENLKNLVGKLNKSLKSEKYLCNNNSTLLNKTKDIKQKFKISQALKKIQRPRSPPLSNQQFLNIFDDSNSQIKIQQKQAMDLRLSFENLQQQENKILPNQYSEYHKKQKINNNNHIQQSMDLRDSFCALQKKKSDHQKTISSVRNSRNIQQQNIKLKNQNKLLKNQLDKYKYVLKDYQLLNNNFNKLIEQKNILQIQNQNIYNQKLNIQNRFHQEIIEKEQLRKKIIMLENQLSLGKGLDKNYSYTVENSSITIRSRIQKSPTSERHRIQSRKEMPSFERGR